MGTFDEWLGALDRHVDQLSRAPHFVLEPPALVDVRDEMRRIRSGNGTPDGAASNDNRPVIENARVIAEQLEDARHVLLVEDHEELVRFTEERLVEASLRYR
jgi:hypothetical protein